MDGYAGYRKLAENGDIQLAFCWAHVRRRFYELAIAGNAPIASEMLARIAKLNAIDPQLYLADVITKIANGHPNTKIDELLPWSYPASPILSRVA